jgi:hypothetical protein
MILNQLFETPLPIDFNINTFPKLNKGAPFVVFDEADGAIIATANTQIEANDKAAESAQQTGHRVSVVSRETKQRVFSIKGEEANNYFARDNNPLAETFDELPSDATDRAYNQWPNRTKKDSSKPAPWKKSSSEVNESFLPDGYDAYEHVKNNYPKDIPPGLQFIINKVHPRGAVEATFIGGVENGNQDYERWIDQPYSTRKPQVRHDPNYKWPKSWVDESSELEEGIPSNGEHRFRGVNAFNRAAEYLGLKFKDEGDSVLALSKDGKTVLGEFDYGANTGWIYAPSTDRNEFKAVKEGGMANLFKDELDEAKVEDMKEISIDDFIITANGDTATIASKEPRGQAVAAIKNAAYDARKKRGVVAVLTQAGKDLKDPNVMLKFMATKFTIKTSGDALQIATELATNSAEEINVRIRSRQKSKAEAPARNAAASKHSAARKKASDAEIAAKLGLTPKDIKRVTYRQVGGDDGYQYNVFIDNKSIVSGLTLGEVPHYKMIAYKMIAKQNGTYTESVDEAKYAGFKILNRESGKLTTYPYKKGWSTKDSEDAALRNQMEVTGLPRGNFAVHDFVKTMNEAGEQNRSFKYEIIPTKQNGTVAESTNDNSGWFIVMNGEIMDGPFASKQEAISARTDDNLAVVYGKAGDYGYVDDLNEDAEIGKEGFPSEFINLVYDDAYIKHDTQPVKMTKKPTISDLKTNVIVVKGKDGNFYGARSAGKEGYILYGLIDGKRVGPNYANTVKEVNSFIKAGEYFAIKFDGRGYYRSRRAQEYEMGRDNRGREQSKAVRYMNATFTPIIKQKVEAYIDYIYANLRKLSNEKKYISGDTDQTNALQIVKRLEDLVANGFNEKTVNEYLRQLGRVDHGWGSYYTNIDSFVKLMKEPLAQAKFAKSILDTAKELHNRVKEMLYKPTMDGLTAESVEEGWESGPEERTTRERDPDDAYDRMRQDKLDDETKTRKVYYVYDGKSRKAVSKRFDNVDDALAARKALPNAADCSVQTANIIVKEEDKCGISQDKETKFHKKLDTLVHDTFGKREEEITESDEGIDNVLTKLRSGRNKIAQGGAYSDSGKQVINNVYDILRRALMQGDVERFWLEWKHLSSQFPDAFDALMDESDITGYDEVANELREGNLANVGANSELFGKRQKATNEALDGGQNDGWCIVSNGIVKAGPFATKNALDKWAPRIAGSIKWGKISQDGSDRYIATKKVAEEAPTGPAVAWNRSAKKHETLAKRARDAGDEEKAKEEDANARFYRNKMQSHNGKVRPKQV